MLARTLLLLLTTAAIALPAEWTKRFPVTGPCELRIDTNDASVRVRTGSSPVVEARVSTEGWKIGGDEVRVTGHQTGNRVELDVRVPQLHFNFGGNRSVRIELIVPAQISTQIHTGDGSVGIDGLKGDISIVTGDGSITADRLEGKLDARTGDGRIEARGRFDVLKLRTNDGSIEASAERGSQLASPWRVQTGDGSVRLRLPAELSANLDVHTGDGGIHSNLPLADQGPKSENTLRGKLGNGGLTFTVRTGDGSVNIDRL